MSVTIHTKRPKDMQASKHILIAFEYTTKAKIGASRKVFKLWRQSHFPSMWLPHLEEYLRYGDVRKASVLRFISAGHIYIQFNYELMICCGEWWNSVYLLVGLAKSHAAIWNGIRTRCFCCFSDQSVCVQPSLTSDSKPSCLLSLGLGNKHKALCLGMRKCGCRPTGVNPDGYTDPTTSLEFYFRNTVKGCL